MSTVVYSSSQVASFLNDAFIPVKIDFQDSGGLKSKFNVVWTPTLIIVDRGQREHWRTVPGSYPENEFLAKVRTGLGRSHQNKKNYDRALDAFQTVQDEHGDPNAAAEALYWRGVTHYQQDNVEGLMENWKELRDRFPGSDLAKATTFIEE